MIGTDLRPVVKISARLRTRDFIHRQVIKHIFGMYICIYTTEGSGSADSHNPNAHRQNSSSVHFTNMDSRFDDAPETGPENRWLGNILRDRRSSVVLFVLQSNERLLQLQRCKKTVEAACTATAAPYEWYAGPLSFLVQQEKAFPPDLFEKEEDMWQGVFKNAPSEEDEEEPSSRPVSPSDDGDSLGTTSDATSSSKDSVVGENDVLFGRGKGVSNWVGNVRFRQLVDLHAAAYAKTETRAQKRAICITIVETIYARGGRFLEKDTDLLFPVLTNEANRGKALTKTSQALRQANYKARPHSTYLSGK